ncbi:hypothetical protein IFM89_029361 [Coptis chinensis]|uniref:RNase H type-1 domain-containing protein n=1 Tax=Coptis chinensis TaxID=261450 RepID=A0A835ISW7_9MAGN|nr:hypothetical protein IFM89_029361 [Coptis chinensis]
MKAFIYATVNGIWTERNSRRFDHIQTQAQEVTLNIIRTTRLYLQTKLKEVADTAQTREFLHRIGVTARMKGKVLTNCIWMKPDEDVLKLNSDGSVTNDNTGFGGMLRDSNGEVKLAYTRSNGSHSVLFQELQGIKYGLIGSLHLSNNKIMVASDSLNAIQILNQKVQPLGTASTLL